MTYLMRITDLEGNYSDLAGNDANLDLPIDGQAGSLLYNKDIEIDGIKPTVTSVTSSSLNGTYGVGDIIDIAMTFSEPVYVTGEPILILETGTADSGADYSYGSGTNTLHFTYTLTSHLSSDLEATDFAPVMAGSNTTIKDIAGNPAVLTFPSSGASGSLSTNKDIVIDGSQTILRDIPTWSALSSGVNENLTAVDFINSNVGWAVGGLRGDGYATVLKTTDGGSNWSKYNLIGGVDLYEVVAINSDKASGMKFGDY